MQKPAAKDENSKPVADKENPEGQQETEGVPAQKQEKEELRPQDLTANPNAVSMMDLFRPEITQAAAEEVVLPGPVEAIPQEAVEEAGMNLDGQMPALNTGVETSVEMESSPDGEQASTFQETLEEPMETVAPEEAPVQQTTERQETAAPQQTVEKAAPEENRPVAEVSESQDDGEELAGEPVEAEQIVFHEAEAAPVKVGERYETVDTQQPDMEARLAETIRQAAQAGAERVEIKLNPANLGALTIEMTKDASGALQVVLHASNSRAAGLLSQHLDGLHAALQSYGAGQEVQVEVQRGQESQQQHFQQADPDGRGQQHHRQQQESRQEDQTAGGEDFLQKLRLGLFGGEGLN